MSYILVIDGGTSEFKTVLFNRQLEIAGSASSEFEVFHPAPDQTELDAESYWFTCIDTVHEAVKEGNIDPHEIDAVAVTSHTDTLFVLDEFGSPVTNAILWTDSRAKEQADRIQRHFGLEKLFHTTGQTGASYIHFASRLAWFIENKAELLNSARYLLQTQDYLIYRLSGQAVQDHSIASSSLLCYLEKRAYWREMLDMIGVDENKLCGIIAPGEVAGKLTVPAAETLGIKSGIPVVAAAMDAIAAAVAMGNVETGVISEITGSVLVIGATCDEPKFDEQIRVPCFVHAVPGKYLLMPWCETAGMALKWYRDQFFRPWVSDDDLESRNLYELITSEAAETPPGSDGVILLPHFSGSGSPEFNPDAKAVIYGLTTTHQRKHISRAFLESVAFMLKQNLDILSNMGVGMNRIISSGGGSRSSLWCQIKADVTGLPVSVADVPEATARGAAILTANALGWQSDDLSAPTQKETIIFKPDSGAHEEYKNAFERFLKLNQILQPLFNSK